VLPHHPNLAKLVALVEADERVDVISLGIEITLTPHSQPH
jgi:hypothetical protein